MRDRDPADDEAVWSLNCFVVPRAMRHKGVARRLLDGAVEHARSHGATAVEAYPVVPTDGLVAAELYTGLLPWFLDAGFRPVGPETGRRRLVRRDLA